MQWYLVVGESRVGPVSSSDILAYVVNQDIKLTTLVWSSEMDEWQPLRGVLSRVKSTAEDQDHRIPFENAPKADVRSSSQAGAMHAHSSPVTEPAAKQAAAPTPVLGIVSVGCGVGSLVMPYFAAVFFAPVGIICGIIAARKGQVGWGTVGGILGLLGLVFVVYMSQNITHIGSGILGDHSSLSAPTEHQSVQSMMRDINSQVANDAVRQYRIAKQSGSEMDACVQAGFVAAAYLQAHDESNYQKWKATEKVECATAGLSY